MLKFIMVAFMLPFILISPIYAEEQEQGEVIIHTDGTYSDHEVIEACEVGKMVKLDIGSFDTAYINNNFDYNANIDGYIYFECVSTNDIKLAYYGINQTIYTNDISSLNEFQLNYLENFNFDEFENIFIFYEPNYQILQITTDFTYTLNDTYITRFHYYAIYPDVVYSIAADGQVININSYPTYFFKYDDVIIYNGLPEYITGYVNFDEIASIYINPIFDSYSQSISSIDAPTYSIELSNYNMTLNGQLHCEYFYSGTDLCAYYEFENKVEDSNGNSITNPYANITLPSIFINNTNNASSLGVDGYYNYTFHYDILITFDDEYTGYLNFANTGKFYVNGSELRFTKTTTYRSDSPDFYYNLVLTDYSLKRKIDPLVNPVEEEQKESVSKNETQNAELDSVITEYNEIETQFKDNLDTSLNDIDFSFDFGNITDFSTSANFVRTQFDNLTDNPFGSLVGFSLAVGLALLIMGRRL